MKDPTKPGPRTTSPGFTLARIAGIEVNIDWSLAVVFWLITFNLGGGLFRLQHPDWSSGKRWVLGLAAAILFFLSILVHELAHAFVARRRDVPIEGITLFIFGGAARLQAEPKTPGAEFLIAIAGPVTSLIIGIGALVGGLGLAPPAAVIIEAPRIAIMHLGAVATLLLWLGPVNIALALFNLLPGYPLDGGRVFKAIVWKLSGSESTAASWASGAGRAIAVALMLLGATMMFGTGVPYLGGGFVQGLWLILIGWFLNNAAIQGRRQVIVRKLLSGVPVGKLMRSDAVGVPVDLTLSALVDTYLMRSDQHCYPVVLDERLMGIVCFADVRKVPRAEWEHTLVLDVMTPVDSLSVVTPDEPAADALRKLTTRDIDQVPVIEEGRLLGILRRADILRWLQLQATG